MKNLLPLPFLLIALLLPGCAWTKRQFTWHHAATASQPAPAAQTQIVTPDDSLAARVVSVNTVGRFVVLNFPEGRMPKLDQHMYLYRAGLKSAEVKVAGPQQDTSIVADLVAGDAMVGDTVRDQ
jgi:hypothetical protein